MSNARNLANLLGTGTQITTADIADEVFQANKNFVINGSMQVAQRGTSFADPSDQTYSLDRMHIFNSNDGATTITQDSTVPSGEELYKSLIDIVVIFLKFGAFLLVNKIGIKDKDINRETKING